MRSFWRLCNLDDDSKMREFDVPYFDGKCKTFVDGYRYVPSGETWTRSDGTEFHGEMIAPWKDYSALAMAQQAYEQAQAENDVEIAELMDELELLCNELIGE